MSQPAPKPGGSPRRSAAGVGGAVLLLAPAVALAAIASRGEGFDRALVTGLAVALAVEAMYLLFRYGHRYTLSTKVPVAFYLVAYLAVRFLGPSNASGVHEAIAGGLLMAVVALVAVGELRNVAGPSRRARFLIRQLLQRTEWPPEFSKYRGLPDVQALREELKADAGPALPLLAHPDVRVQVAALSAMEFQPVWRKGQAEVVIQRANSSEEAAVRAAAVAALGNVVKSRHVVAMLPFLRDPAAGVRHCAAIAVLWDAARRWPEIRGQVRDALADPNAARDGPLPCSASYPPAAIDDLVMWSHEAGPIGRRATQTLIRHFKKAILEDGTPETIEAVTRFIENPKVSPALRVEIAHRLQAAEEFPPELAGRLIGPTSPTMLRLISAGVLLAQRDDSRAIDVLKEAAQQPNREIALVAAGMIQKYLGVDMGLGVGSQLPEVNSREAAEVTRKVLSWASDPASQLSGEIPVGSAFDEDEWHISDAGRF